MTSGRSDLVDIAGFLRGPGTEKAVLFDDGVTQVWLPRSQIEIEYPPDAPSGMATVTMPEWLAHEKGLI